MGEGHKERRGRPGLNIRGKNVSPALARASRWPSETVIAELGRRCGGELLSLVADADGRKFNHCRVYVNGEPVEDVAKPVHAAESPALVEMILLTAAEGG